MHRSIRRPLSEQSPDNRPKATAHASYCSGAGRWSAVGLLAALLLQTMLGGFSPTGASTNSGWFALIVALMCIPFGGLLLALGIAKWLRNRTIARRE